MNPGPEADLTNVDKGGAKTAPMSADDERGREYKRLAAIYSWDMGIEEARRWPGRLLRRVMDIGTLDDLLSMERWIGRETLSEVLTTAEVGALRPQSWTFWHYRLGMIPPGAPCPPMPARRTA